MKEFYWFSALTNAIEYFFINTLVKKIIIGVLIVGTYQLK